MITQKLFGVTKDGHKVHAYTITNERGISVTVLDYGATLQSVVLPHMGKAVDVVLGYDTVAEYEQNDGYLGASIGRFAGRIPGSLLRVGDEVCSVTANEGLNHLHGGRVGFDKRMWFTDVGNDAVMFTIDSKDGEEGYPGDLRCTVTYTLSGDTLTYAYTGKANRMTAWNPTNHAYWNLNGHETGRARLHWLEIPANRYVPVRPDKIPIALEADTADTPFDFRSSRIIQGSYDHSFILSGGPIRLSGNQGIRMEITTDCKAVQFYNAEYLSERKGKGGAVYRPFGAVCLETQGRQTLRGNSVYEENILYEGLPQTRTTQIRFLYTEG